MPVRHLPLLYARCESHSAHQRPHQARAGTTKRGRSVPPPRSWYAGPRTPRERDGHSTATAPRSLRKRLFLSARVPPHPPAPVSRVKGVGSPLLELLGMAEPPTSLTGPHLPPLGRSAPAEAPPAPFPSPSDLAEPPLVPPEVAPAGPVRPAPYEPPPPPEILRANGHTPAPSTSVLVARLLESTIDGSPMEGWKPRPVAGLEERKSRRWPLLLIATGICLALLTGAKWLVDVPARHADDMRNDLAVAASQLGRSLPRLMRALGPVTNPGAGQERLVSSSGTLVDLGSASRALSLEANRPLPWAAPFSSDEPTDALRGPRRTAARLAGATNRIEERLTAALAYRAGLRQTFALPRLPVSASPARSPPARNPAGGSRHPDRRGSLLDPSRPCTQGPSPPSHAVAQLLRWLAGAISCRAARRQSRTDVEPHPPIAREGEPIASGPRRPPAGARRLGASKIIRSSPPAARARPSAPSALDLSTPHLFDLEFGQLALEVGGVPEALVHAGEAEVGDFVEHP